MKTRCKFKVTNYDPSIEEDRKFSASTPTGKMTFACENPRVLEDLALGQDFYVDLVPVEPEPPARAA